MSDVEGCFLQSAHCQLGSYSKPHGTWRLSSPLIDVVFVLLLVSYFPPFGGLKSEIRLGRLTCDYFGLSVLVRSRGCLGAHAHITEIRDITEVLHSDKNAHTGHCSMPTYRYFFVMSTSKYISLNVKGANHTIKRKKTFLVEEREDKCCTIRGNSFE